MIERTATPSPIHATYPSSVSKSPVTVEFGS